MRDARHRQPHRIALRWQTDRMHIAATEMFAPLLRSPPFAGVDAAVSRPGPTGTPALDEEEIDRLFAAIREARVGGRFWAPPASQLHLTILVRPRSVQDIDQALATLSETEHRSVLWLLPPAKRGRALARALARRNAMMVGDVDPWSLLDGEVRLVAHGDDEWVALAHIAGPPRPPPVRRPFRWARRGRCSTPPKHCREPVEPPLPQSLHWPQRNY